MKKKHALNPRSNKGIFKNGYYKFFDEVLAHSTYSPQNQQSLEEQNLQMDRAASKRARKAMRGTKNESPQT